MRKISFLLAFFLLAAVGFQQLNLVYAADVNSCTTPTRLSGLVSLQDGTPVKDSVILVYSGNKSFGNVYNVLDGHYIFIFPIEAMASGKASGRVAATYKGNRGESAFDISCGDTKEVDIILGIIKTEPAVNQSNKETNNPVQPPEFNQPVPFQPGGSNLSNPDNPGFNLPAQPGVNNPTSNPNNTTQTSPSVSNPAQPGKSNQAQVNQAAQNSNKSAGSNKITPSGGQDNADQDSVSTIYILLAVLVLVVVISVYVIKKKG